MFLHTPSSDMGKDLFSTSVAELRRKVGIRSSAIITCIQLRTISKSSMKQFVFFTWKIVHCYGVDTFNFSAFAVFFNLFTLVHLDSMLFRLKSTQLPCCSTCRPSRGTRRRGGSPSSSSCRRGERWASSSLSWSWSLSLTLLLAGGGAEDHRCRTSSGEKSCCCRRESTGGETSGGAGDRQELAGEEGEEGGGGGRSQGGLEREGGRIVILLEISRFHRNSSSNRIRPIKTSF